MLVSRMTGSGADPVVALAAPRPDFDGAVQEFLVGLLTASLQPDDEAAWLDRWHSPPSVEALQAAVNALPDAFDLDGDGPRFFQDRSAGDFARAPVTPIEALLIEAPGEQTQKLNKDLFIKRDRIARVSRPVAAMALVTMQTYAPAGGQGYRTSMRGGGPLTTLVDPRVDEHDAWRAHDQPLWQKLWVNVETTEQLAARTPPQSVFPIETAFPWLAPTRSSNIKKGGVATTPAQAHPLQAYFGLPRRIRLEFDEGGTCDLTGQRDDRTVVGFRPLNYGVQYDGWKHPLSPHYRQKLTEPWLPVHGQPGGIAWRDWLALTLADPAGGLREPAGAVAHFPRRARAIRRRAVRVHAFGYDMDNMKARGWTDAVLPAFAVQEEERRELLYNTARSLTEATSLASTALLGAVKTALFQSPDDAHGDLGQVRLDLWAATERAFYAVVGAVADPTIDEDSASERAETRRREYLAALTDAATAVFDRWCPTGSLPLEELRRQVAGRYGLLTALRGYSKLGESIFGMLGLAPPGGGRTARAAKNSRTPKEKAT